MMTWRQFSAGRLRKPVYSVMGQSAFNRFSIQRRVSKGVKVGLRSPLLTMEHSSVFGSIGSSEAFRPFLRHALLRCRADAAAALAVVVDQVGGIWSKREADAEVRVSNVPAVLAGLSRVLRTRLDEFGIDHLEMIQRGHFAQVAVDRAILEAAIVELVESACQTTGKRGTLTVQTSIKDVSFISPRMVPRYVRPGKYVIIEVLGANAGFAQKFTHSKRGLRRLVDPFRNPEPAIPPFVHRVAERAHGFACSIQKTGGGTARRLYFPLYQKSAAA